MKTLRTTLLVVSASLTAPFALLAGWSVSERMRDPVAAVRRADAAPRVVRDSAYEGLTRGGEPRLFRDLHLETGSAGRIKVTVSRPVGPVERPLPLVFILAGLRTGRDALDVVEVHGPNLLVGYEYPYSQETWYEGGKLRQIPAIRKAVLDVPAQVVAVAGALAGEPDVDGERASLLGYSFGAMFVPAVQRLAMEGGTPFQGLVLAYGGTDIRALLDANIKLRSATLRRGIAWTGATALYAMEPDHHLPHLTGRFLVIRGEQDDKIPAAASARLAELTPHPKKVMSLPDGHMGPGNPELTQRIVRLSLEWLRAERLIDWSAGGGHQRDEPPLVDGGR
jgi:pimeloyl-ACP methyl ester carboxylesterase